MLGLDDRAKLTFISSYFYKRRYLVEDLNYIFRTGREETRVEEVSDRHQG